MAIDIYYRCFIFSREQYEHKESINRKLGKVTTLGQVLVNGIPKPYTDILTSMSRARFSDSVEVISGDIRKIKYEPPKE